MPSSAQATCDGGEGILSGSSDCGFGRVCGSSMGLAGAERSELGVIGAESNPPESSEMSSSVVGNIKGSDVLGGDWNEWSVLAEDERGDILIGIFRRGDDPEGLGLQDAIEYLLTATRERFSLDNGWGHSGITYRTLPQLPLR